MVDDNFCFIVDGQYISNSDMLGDSKWWRHTSKPTKYFYSDNMRTFHKVSCISTKGKIIAAKITSNRMELRRSSVVFASRDSVCLPSPYNSPQRGEQIPLSRVYKIMRFYSFWKTCTSFHRIVTLMEKITDDPSNETFKKRFFVQYLWRNVKPSEKARVKKEYDLANPKELKATLGENSLHDLSFNM